ncbi:MAG TPA: CapA family protein [Candidatus Paceibacterota bacterium]|nr:CapA family protein [Candidatus Paceibacterota bacterium]
MLPLRAFGIAGCAAALAGAAFIVGPQTASETHIFNDRARPDPIIMPETVTLLFAGDIMLSRSVGDVMARSGDWLLPFRDIASVTAGADAAFANLETTISLRGSPAGCGYCFRADPRAVDGLVYAGFDVVSVANNHIFDYGPEAFTDTLANLDAAGIRYAGGGADAPSAREPVVLELGRTRVAYLAYTNLLPAGAGAAYGRAGASLYDAETMAGDIVRARGLADIVVVSFHAGEEYETEPGEWQERVYREAVDAGADLVIGHHPHVVQPVVAYGEGWIAYSLGNFVFDQTFSEATMRGLLLEATVRGNEVLDVREISVDISRQYRPSLADDGAGR